MNRFLHFFALILLLSPISSSLAAQNYPYSIDNSAALEGRGSVKTCEDNGDKTASSEPSKHLTWCIPPASEKPDQAGQCTNKKLALTKLPVDPGKESIFWCIPLSADAVQTEAQRYSSKYAIPCKEIAGSTCPDQNAGIAEYITRLYTFGLMIAGAAAFGMIIFGGLRYVFAAGDLGTTQDAKETITQALWGLLLLLMAYIILYTINPNLVTLRNPQAPKLEINTQQPGINLRGDQQPQSSGQNAPPPAQIEGCSFYVNLDIGVSSNIQFEGPLKDTKIKDSIGGSRCLKCQTGYVKNFEGGCIACSAAREQGYQNINSECPPGPLPQG